MAEPKTPGVEVVFQSLPDGTDPEVWATSAAIVESTGLSKSTVNKHLRSLVDEKRVTHKHEDGTPLYQQVWEQPSQDQTEHDVLADGSRDRQLDALPDAVGLQATFRFASDDEAQRARTRAEEGHIKGLSIFGDAVPETQTTPATVHSVQVYDDNAATDGPPPEHDAGAPQTSADETGWPTVATPPAGPESSDVGDVAAYLGAVRPVSAAPAPAEESSGPKARHRVKAVTVVGNNATCNECQRPAAMVDGKWRHAKPERQQRKVRERREGEHQYAVFAPGKLQESIEDLLRKQADRLWRASEVGKELNAQAGSVTFALQQLAGKGTVVRLEDPPRWKAA